MSEQFSSPHGQVLDQKTSNLVLVEGLLGGNNIGGEVFIYSDNEPLVDKSEGFKVGELSSDLLMTMGLGTTSQEKAYNTLGIVRTKLGSNTTDVDDILLVRLEMDKNGKYFVPDNLNGSPSSIKLQPGKELHIGRGKQNNSEDISNLNMTADLKMSSKHLTIELGEHGSVRVTDTNSTNGTEIKLMGEQQKFTHEDLKSDMDRLKLELAHKAGETALVSEVEPSSQVKRLIDSVPKSADEVRQMRLDEEDSDRKHKVEANAARIAELTARMDYIIDTVGPEQAQLLWNYGSYESQSRELHAKGQHGAAEDLSRFARQELEKMKPATAAFKYEYWSTMTERNRLEFP